MKSESESEINIDEFEGRKFILGRQGHILLTSTEASRQHAEIIIRKGKVYLRDLGSKNGVYLKKGNKLIRFKAGNVSLLQRIVICNETYMIRDLLAIASQFIDSDDNTTRVPHDRKTAGE